MREPARTLALVLDSRRFILRAVPDRWCVVCDVSASEVADAFSATGVRCGAASARSLVACADSRWGQSRVDGGCLRRVCFGAEGVHDAVSLTALYVPRCTDELSLLAGLGVSMDRSNGDGLTPLHVAASVCMDGVDEDGWERALL